ncbi:hypothetical protein ACIA6D_42955 [Streptomyces cacaoi]|uniref:hypothetical protein n=1 Tax=Streptomyces cacaoi TaxID=1898 RepID=UPI003748BCE4
MNGSWWRLVFANPDVPHGLADKAAYSFRVLEHLHRSLSSRLDPTEGLKPALSSTVGMARL